MRIWNFISGYVMIRVEGLSLEKFLNIAAQAGVSVFNARRVSYTVLRAGVSAGGYRRLSRLSLDRYRITVERRTGIPFGLVWIWKRKALLFGLAVVAAAVFFASLFVWDVQVTGLEDEKEADAIREELAALGVKAGVYHSSIDFDEITTRMIIDHDEIAWMDLSRKGVVISAEIVLAEPVPEVVDENTPCNIVAEKDAYIESIIAKSGRAAVEAGDTVRAGDVLISGLVWNEGFPRMLFAARGDVIGNVWYTATASRSIYDETREQTGRKETGRLITIGADSAAVDGACSFDIYDTQVIEEYYIGDGLFLPVKVSVIEYSEVVVSKTPTPLESLKVELEERAYYDAQAKVPEDAEIVGHETIFEIVDDIMTATVYLQTQEDIGKVEYLEE